MARLDLGARRIFHQIVLIGLLERVLGDAFGDGAFEQNVAHDLALEVLGALQHLLVVGQVVFLGGDIEQREVDEPVDELGEDQLDLRLIFGRQVARRLDHVADAQLDVVDRGDDGVLAVLGLPRGGRGGQRGGEGKGHEALQGLFEQKHSPYWIACGRLNRLKKPWPPLLAGHHARQKRDHKPSFARGSHGLAARRSAAARHR